MNVRAVFTVDRVVYAYAPPAPVIPSHLKKNLTANDQYTSAEEHYISSGQVEARGVVAGDGTLRAVPMYPVTGAPVAIEPAPFDPAATSEPVVAPSGYIPEGFSGPVNTVTREPAFGQEAAPDGTVIALPPVAAPVPDAAALKPGEFSMNCGDGRILIGTLAFHVQNATLTPSALVPGTVHYIDIAFND